MSESGAIYFIQVGEDGPIKIGFSGSPRRRLTTLQSSHYERLHLIGLREGSRFDEQELHQRLARFALGREWDASVPEVLAEIEEPLTRVAVPLDRAVVAREHLQRAIALLRGSDHERGCEELRAVVRLVAEALKADEVPA